MANTGILEGQDLLLYVSTDDGSNWDAIAHATSHVFNLNTEMRQRNTKDTGKWDAKKAGLLSWSLTSENLRSYDGYNFDDLYTIWQGRTRVMVKFAGRAAVDSNDDWTAEASGDKYRSGYAYIESITENETKNADGTMSIAIAGDGALTETTVPA